MTIKDKPDAVKIINISAANRHDVYGLGDDGKVYIWQTNTGTWLLNTRSEPSGTVQTTSL